MSPDYFRVMGIPLLEGRGFREQDSRENAAPVALIMTAVGIYGVVSYAVNQRLHEIGIRIALGARRSDIFTRVVGRGLLLVGIGVCTGLVAALGLTRFLGSFLFGVTQTDPWIYSGGVFLIAAVALWSCTPPARRASQVDPITTLRNE